MLLPLAALPMACSGVTPTDAARLAQDGDEATTRLMEDVEATRLRVERSRDLLLLRAALVAPAGTTPEALRAMPRVAGPDAELAAAVVVLVQGHAALRALRDSYRAFGTVAAGRSPERFDAALDRAAEDADALRTVIERYAANGADIVESLPGGGAVVGAVRLTGGMVSRARTAARLAEPNEALIIVLDSLIGSAKRESETLGVVLQRVAADRAEDVAAQLRRRGIVRAESAAALDRLAENFGWSVSPQADERLRDASARQMALGFAAIEARRAVAEPARMIDPGAGIAVLEGLRDRHLALRGSARLGPNTLRDGLRRLAR